SASIRARMKSRLRGVASPAASGLVMPCLLKLLYTARPEFTENSQCTRCPDVEKSPAVGGRSALGPLRRPPERFLLESLFIRNYSDPGVVLETWTPWQKTHNERARHGRTCVRSSARRGCGQPPRGCRSWKRSKTTVATPRRR